MILDARRRWECPSCHQQIETDKPPTSTPLHPCLAQGGLMVPFAPVHGNELAPNQVRHVLVERGDYLGTEQAQPTMAVRTERADGSNDCTVFAPAASATQE